MGLKGYAVTILNNNLAAEKIERNLRALDVPIITRVAHDKIYLDVRTIQDEDIDLLVDEIAKVIL